MRFEGNNYSEAWVKEAARRGLLNLRRTPEALAQLVTPASAKLLTGLGILTKEELESRYHVRLERYVKDMLIEMHTLEQMVGTLVLPAAMGYAGQLAAASANAKAGGIKVAPQVAEANRIGKQIAALVAAGSGLRGAIAKAEGMHDVPDKQARFLTADGAEAMAAVREASDALELSIADTAWPLPRYREMLFPV